MLLSIRYPDKKKLIMPIVFFLNTREPFILLPEKDKFKHAYNERDRKF